MRLVLAFALALFTCTAEAAPAQTAPPQMAAAGLPEHVALAVTGDPATPDFLSDQIRAAVTSALAPILAPSGSTVSLGPIWPAPAPLASGFLTNFRVPVRIDPAGGATPGATLVTVDVINTPLPAFRPRNLSFKDDPERITAQGVLSRTTVEVGQPTRLYYYHENKGQPRRFVVVLSANGSVRTRVQVVGAAAGPDRDVMGVGHAVTKTFLTLEPRNEGIVIDIAGGKPLLERDSVVGPGDGIVGATDFNVLEGGPLTATVMAIAPGTEPAAYLYAAKLGNDGHARHGTFDLRGFAQRIIAYTAGGPDATYVYGARGRTLENTAPGDAGHDYGDYGVLQRVAFDLDNPSPAPVTLYLYEKPLGGAVRSSFLVNGTLVDVGCVRAAHHYLIAPVELGPRSTGRVDVLTMTDGGSNYPLEIGLTALAPVPAAPPISDVDGCFPKPAGGAASTQPAAGPGGQ